tara:strand:+ start:2792 stop:5152 length:2361 start_codon:yes stop_codon:yes gene_type:complete
MVKYKAPHGQYLEYPDNDFVSEFLNAGWYEFREIAFFYRFLRRGDRVLDIGAHCGLYSAIAQSIVGKQGYVLAIEPNAALAPSISSNIGVESPLTDIANLTGTGSEWLAVAAMDEAGVVYLSDEAEEKSAYREVHTSSTGASLAVPAVSVDDITGALEGGFHFVKVDVEGVEGLVLKGMAQTLTDNESIVLMIEFTEANQHRHSGSTHALADVIRDAGFGLYRYDDLVSQLVELDDDVELEHMNIFACRKVDQVNVRLSGASAKQARIADDVIMRGRASEALYKQTLDYKNFRKRSTIWVSQISAALQQLRGDDPAIGEGMKSAAAELSDSAPNHEQSGALSRLLEDGLGQVEATASAIAKSIGHERRVTGELERRFAAAETYITEDLLLQADSFESDIWDAQSGLGEGLLMLRDLQTGLAGTLSEEHAAQLDAYIDRVQAESAGHLANMLEARRLRSLLLAATERLRNQQEKLDATISAKAEVDRRWAEDVDLLTNRNVQLEQDASRTHELRAELAILQSEHLALNEELVRSKAESEERVEALRSDAERQAAENARHIEALRSNAERQTAENAQRIEEIMAETARVLDEVRADHVREVEALESELSDAARGAERSTTIARMAVAELRNMVFDATNEQSVIQDIARSIRASRIASLVGLLGVGPRKTAAPLIVKSEAANARLAEIQTRIAFLETYFSPDQKAGAANERVPVEDASAWGMYQDAIDDIGRSRREALSQASREDLQAIGASIMGLRRSRIMRVAAALGLPASRELEALYDIYCARAKL